MRRSNEKRQRVETQQERKELKQEEGLLRDGVPLPTARFLRESDSLSVSISPHRLSADRFDPMFDSWVKPGGLF